MGVVQQIVVVEQIVVVQGVLIVYVVQGVLTLHINGLSFRRVGTPCGMSQEWSKT
jgi:hypothetical protein